MRTESATDRRRLSQDIILTALRRSYKRNNKCFRFALTLYKNPRATTTFVQVHCGVLRQKHVENQLVFSALTGKSLAPFFHSTYFCFAVKRKRLRGYAKPSWNGKTKNRLLITINFICQNKHHETDCNTTEYSIVKYVEQHLEAQKCSYVGRKRNRN